jgi:hypothetical protein
MLSRSEAAASTNPLSLTPAEVLQYRLAGLELDEEIPNVKGWPHRGLPAERMKDAVGSSVVAGDGDNADNSVVKVHEDEEAKRAEQGPRLRLQHLSVLTAILQRCLLEGDISRASRAWALLIRAQVGGQGIDLRSSGYWSIGAELLVRNGEKPPTKHRRSSDADSEHEDPQPEHHEAELTEKGEKDWGSKDGREKAKDYYERLILQHPYKRQFHESVSALDFWPAMVGCEIYGIQQEQKESLRKVADEYKDGDEADGDENDSETEPVEEEEDVYAAEDRRKTRRRRKRAERRWQQQGEIRKTALEAYEKIAARLDELMTTPPYSDSHALLRLRGMLALCIGDLSFPGLPVDYEAEDEDEESFEGKRRLGIGGKDTERRFLLRQRLADYERGKKKQREEHLRARKIFERIEKETGRKEGVTYSLPGEEDDPEESFDADS